MIRLNNRQINILEKITLGGEVSSSDVFSYLNERVSLITVKRDLDYLTTLKYLERKGKGRSTFYLKTILGTLFTPINAEEYNKVDPDKRSGDDSFNFKLFENFPRSLFFDEEKKVLDTATKNYSKKIKKISNVIKSKELERFVIELSWKSSKIEGNTYTLLDTEKLIKEGIPSNKNTKEETTMILNHKKAFSFVLKNVNLLSKKGINSSFVEKVHEILIDGLGVKKGVRNGLVGITGTKYKPLDNKYQINEALEELYKTVNKIDDVYSRALSLLVGISYIQPFEDGNKRAARLLSNAILLAYNCAPLSYRSVDEEKYRESILVFYEKNSIMPMKNIFLNQYLFSTENYLVK